MHILGISAYYHDSAACLIRDGEIVAAAQEERFTRKKHDRAFPTNAIAYCLREAGVSASELDYVAFYEKPLLKFDRLLETYLAFAPEGYRSFREALPRWLHEKLKLRRELREGIGGQFKGKYVFTEHHESHAASAFFPSPYEEAAILTLDGVGEWATSTMGIGRGNRIELLHEIRFPHSLGLLYSALTYFAGFKVNSGEYKLMGLAPYGRPVFTSTILDNLIDLRPDGSFRLDLSYFNYCQGLTMTSPKMDALFGGPPRRAESPITQREMDIAASIQEVTDEVLLRCARHLARETKAPYLVLAGGVALNCVANGKVLRDGCFKDIWVQPAAGDAGGSLGAALFVWHQLLEQPRLADGIHDKQSGSLLGPRYGEAEIRAFLDAEGAAYHYFPEEDALLDAVTKLLIEQNVVGLLQGRMEFGPRALGGRSIVADPRSEKMQSTMNLKIKFRESFRPFAPSVLRSQAAEWFDIAPHQESPYMLMVAPVRNERRHDVGDAEHAAGFDRMKERRSEIPAVTHVDYSARVQTVDSRNGRYERLLTRFHDKTGCPVLINTSFNIRGEPIVCSPEHAYRCFLGCEMDALIIENFVLLKDAQVQATPAQIEAYKSQFELD